MTTFAEILSEITGDAPVAEVGEDTDLVLELRVGRAATWAPVGGGGGGLPPQWTQDDATGAVAAASDGIEPTLTIDASPNGDANALVVRYDNSSVGLAISSDTSFYAKGRAGDAGQSGGDARLVGGSSGGAPGGGGGSALIGGAAFGDDDDGGEVVVQGGLGGGVSGVGGSVQIGPGAGDTPGQVVVVDHLGNPVATFTLGRVDIAGNEIVGVNGNIALHVAAGSVDLIDSGSGASAALTTGGVFSTPDSGAAFAAAGTAGATVALDAGGLSIVDSDGVDVSEIRPSFMRVATVDLATQIYSCAINEGFRSQPAAGAAFTALPDGGATSALDAGDLPIIGVADGVNPTDAANVGQAIPTVVTVPFADWTIDQGAGTVNIDEDQSYLVYAKSGKLVHVELWVAFLAGTAGQDGFIIYLSAGTLPFAPNPHSISQGVGTVADVGGLYASGIFQQTGGTAFWSWLKSNGVSVGATSGEDLSPTSLLSASWTYFED